MACGGSVYGWRRETAMRARGPKVRLTQAKGDGNHTGEKVRDAFKH